MFMPERERAPQPIVPPDDFVRFVARLLWESLWPLFGLHLAVAGVVGLAVAAGMIWGIGPLLVLSALTLYPGWLALLAGAASRLRGMHAGAWHAAAYALRRSGPACAVLGLLLNGYLYSYLTSSALVAAGEADGRLMAVWIAQNLFLVVVAATLVYAFPLVALYDQSFRFAIRNGLLLAVRTPGATAAMFAALALLGLAFYWLGISAALFAPFIVNILLVSNCQLQIESHFAGEA
jgi:hypothetical protein